MNSYFLRSPRLGFRLWSPADIELAMRLWGDPRVTEFIGGPFDRTAIQERLAREISMFESHRVQYWPIFRLPDNQHVGCCGLRPYDDERRVFELGVHIRSDCWGQSFASEAAEAVMDHAFRSLGVRGLFAGHHPENHASRHLLRKLGFRYTHDELYPATGCQHPSYAMNREEYLIARRVDAC